MGVGQSADHARRLIGSARFDMCQEHVSQRAGEHAVYDAAGLWLSGGNGFDRAQSMVFEIGGANGAIGDGGTSNNNKFAIEKPFGPFLTTAIGGFNANWVQPTTLTTTWGVGRGGGLDIVILSGDMTAPYTDPYYPNNYFQSPNPNAVGNNKKYPYASYFVRHCDATYDTFTIVTDANFSPYETTRTMSISQFAGHTTDVYLGGFVAAGTAANGWSFANTAWLAQGTMIPGSATQPTVSAVWPNGGGKGGGAQVSILGTNFAGATAVKFGATSVTPSSVVGSLITATAPAGTGIVDVTVVTPGGGTSQTTPAAKFRYADFEPIFQAGPNDPNGVYLGGTEGRFLTFHTIRLGYPLPNGSVCFLWTGCPVQFMGNGFANDDNCVVPTRGAQVIAQSAARAPWYQDFALPESGNCGPGFVVVNSLYDLTWQFDVSGNAIVPPISILVAAGMSKANTINTYARNDSNGTWQTIPSSTSINGGAAQIRSLGEQLDTSATPAQDYLLVGNDSAGIVRGTFAGWPTGFSIGTAAYEPISSDGVTMCKGGPSVCSNLVGDWPVGRRQIPAPGHSPARLPA